MQVRTLFPAVSLCCTVTLASCLSAVRVKRDRTPSTPSEEEGVEGIPFYIKRAVCEQETAYLERILQVWLQIKRGDDVVFSEVKLVKDHALLYRLGDAEAPEVQAAMEALKKSVHGMNAGQNDDAERENAGRNDDGEGDNAPEGIPTLEDLASQFQSLPTAVAARPEDSNSVVVVGNRVRDRVFVDYSTQYFLNATRPWPGSASVTSELGPDGTLSKGAAESDDQILAAVLTAVPPIAEFFVDDDEEDDEGVDAEELMALQLALEEGFQSAPPPEPEYQASLRIQPIDILHTVSKADTIATPPCLAVGGPLAVEDPTASYKREVLKPGGPGGESEGSKKPSGDKSSESASGGPGSMPRE